MNEREQNRNFLTFYLGGVIAMLAVFIPLSYYVPGFPMNIFGESSFSNRIKLLERQVDILTAQLQILSGESVSTSLSVKELARREQYVNQTSEEKLTKAVSLASPSVVSIVISKAVPQLEVEYINPFGNDRLFRNFDVKIPVYRQSGTVEQQVGAGSGFIVTSDGYILTNKHVVSDSSASYTVLLSTGVQKVAKIVYVDESNDVAIIKIDGSYSPLSLGDSAALKLGQSVVAIGNALGEYSNSVSVGIISGLNRTIEASDGRGSVESLSGVIQTDAAINRGNSGGPLLDLSGKVVGVNVATVLGSNSISFAIPSNTVRSIVKNIISIP